MLVFYLPFLRLLIFSSYRRVDVANRLESIMRDYMFGTTTTPGTRRKAGKPCLLIFLLF
jgi:hypothetical protein